MTVEITPKSVFLMLGAGDELHRLVKHMEGDKKREPEETARIEKALRNWDEVLRDFKHLAKTVT